MKHLMLSNLVRGLTGVALVCLLWQPVSGATGLPPVQNLEADSQLAQRQGLPILIFFSADSCGYCELVRELYLEPMHLSGQYRDKVLFRIVHTESRELMQDFRGRLTDHNRFASDQGVNFTPIVRFYDAHGRQLAPELFGYTSPDFYAGMLEQGIERASLALSQGKP